MNNPLSDLEERTRVALPEVTVERRRTRAPERVGFLDIRRVDRLIDRLIVVMWTAEDGLCIAEVDDASVFGDVPDYVVGTVDEALQILMFLLGATDLKDVDGIDAPARQAA
jgi:hypothetical protein